MFYTYVLKIHGVEGKNYYIGSTTDLKRRFGEHRSGKVSTTKNRSPELIYYEAYITEDKARKREMAIKKSGSVYTSLIKRLS